jgi:hypothetical protein
MLINKISERVRAKKVRQQFCGCDCGCRTPFSRGAERTTGSPEGGTASNLILENENKGVYFHDSWQRVGSVPLQGQFLAADEIDTIDPSIRIFNWFDSSSFTDLLL